MFWGLVPQKCHGSEKLGPLPALFLSNRSCGVSRGSFCSSRSKIQILMDLLLFTSAHTQLLGSFTPCRAGIWPSDRFHFISQQICGLTLQDVQHNTVAICHSPGSCQLQQLAEKIWSQNRRQSDLRDCRSVTAESSACHSTDIPAPLGSAIIPAGWDQPWAFLAAVTASHRPKSPQSIALPLLRLHIVFSPLFEVPPLTLRLHLGLLSLVHPE